MQKSVNIFSPSWEMAESYGRVAHELKLQFERDDTHVNMLGKMGSVSGVIKPALGGFLLGYPNNHAMYGPMVEMGRKISLTMFESTRIPTEWVEPLNASDGVIVPATFLVDVFRECGVTSPIHVVPLGISEVFRQYRPRVRTATKERPFTFIAIGDRGMRKGWGEAAQAFVRAFGDDMRYRLIIKARSLPIRLTNANVEVINEDYSDGQMAALYGRCHVMLFPTKGEGFGLPPREFAATGGLSIVTPWGGTADEVDQWALKIPFTMVEGWGASKPRNGDLGQWAEPDVDALVDLMRYVADHYDSYRDFQVRAAGFANSWYRWDVFGRRAIQLWKGLTDGNNSNEHREEPTAAQAGA